MDVIVVIVQSYVEEQIRESPYYQAVYKTILEIHPSPKSIFFLLYLFIQLSMSPWTQK